MDYIESTLKTSPKSLCVGVGKNRNSIETVKGGEKAKERERQREREKVFLPGMKTGSYKNTRILGESLPPELRMRPFGYPWLCCLA